MEFTTIIGGDVLFVTHSCIMPPVAVVPAPTTLLRRHVISSNGTIDCEPNSTNETVSVGDTAVSLHTFGGGGRGILGYSKVPKSWPNFHFRGVGWGYSWLRKWGGVILGLLKTRSPKSWPNFQFLATQVGWGLFLATQNSKSQVLTKFSFSGGWGGVILGYASGVGLFLATIDINNSCIPVVTQRDCVSYIPLGTTV